MTVYSNANRIITFIAVLAFALFVLSCSDNSTNKRHSRGQLVSVAKTVLAPMQSSQVLSGSLEALRTVDIYNQVEGLILEITPYPNDRVEEAQTIIKLDSQLIRAELKKADITQQQAALDLKRVKQLRQKHITSDEILARAQTALDIAKANKAVLQTRYEYTQIKAPFTGVISRRLKEPGDVVAKYSQILTLADTSQLKVTISLSERLIPNIKQGDTVLIQIDAIDSKNYSATITRIYPTIDATTRQGTFEVILNSMPPQAKPGQLCRVIIKSVTTPRLHIPLAAIKHGTKGSYVYKIVNNKAVLTTVTTGIQLGDFIEVTSNLVEGDSVVSKGFIGLSNGKPVKIAL